MKKTHPVNLSETIVFYQVPGSPAYDTYSTLTATYMRAWEAGGGRLFPTLGSPFAPCSLAPLSMQ